MSDLTKSKLLGDRLIIMEEKSGAELSKGGIIIPDNDESTDKASIGRVLQVSTRISECEVEEDKVYVGDRIFFSKYAGISTTHLGEEYRVLRCDTGTT